MTKTKENKALSNLCRAWYYASHTVQVLGLISLIVGVNHAIHGNLKGAALPFAGAVASAIAAEACLFARFCAGSKMREE